MSSIKRLGGWVIAIVGIILSIFGFSGCEKSNEKDQLSFECASVVLENFKENAKPFLSTLEYNYNNTEHETRVKTASSLVSSITKGMSENLKVFENVLLEYAESGDGEIEVTRGPQIIEIKKGQTSFVVKLNESETDFAIISKEGENESLFEIKAKQEGGYLAQIVSKNAGADTYTIYQLDFNLTAGKLCIDETASSFSSIYMADLKESTYPSVSQYVFYN